MTRDPKGRKRQKAKETRQQERVQRMAKPLSDETVAQLNSASHERAELSAPPAHFVANDIILSLTSEVIRARKKLGRKRRS